MSIPTILLNRKLFFLYCKQIASHSYGLDECEYIRCDRMQKNYVKLRRITFQDSQVNLFSSHSIQQAELYMSNGQWASSTWLKVHITNSLANMGPKSINCSQIKAINRNKSFLFNRPWEHTHRQHKYYADCYDKPEQSTCKASPFRAAKNILLFKKSYPIRMLFACSYWHRRPS